MKGEKDMIKRAVFDNFRGFQHMELSDLGAVTLISGKNNSGKSSVLEGILMGLAYPGADIFVLLNTIRGLPTKMVPASLWEPLFYNLFVNQEIKIELLIDNSSMARSYVQDDTFTVPTNLNNLQDVFTQIVSSAQNTYSLAFNFSFSNYSERGHFFIGGQGISRMIEQRENQFVSLPLVHYIFPSRVNNSNAVTEFFGTAELKNQKPQLLEILKIVDNSISDITTVVNDNQPQLYANLHGQWLPLKLAGDGFDRMLLIISSLIAHPNSILLIDEIETGFHYSVYDKLWEAVMTVAKEQKCQVIATTHSYECIESAVNQAKNTGIGDDFCYFRLGRNKKNETVAYRYSAELLSSATDDNLEVR